jgi:hypothetical protein
MSKGNESAFPRGMMEVDNGGDRLETLVADPGLTKRELFAGMAMQAILSNPAYYEQKNKGPITAVLAVVSADALVAELAKDRP